MARYDTYHSAALEAPLMRKWVFRALLLSLLLHAGLFAFFQAKKLEEFRATPEERLAPPRFVVNQVAVDPKTLEQDPAETRLSIADKVPNARIPVPRERPEPKEIELKPQTPEISTPLLSEKPEARQTNWDQVAKLQANSAGAMEKELGSLANSLFKDQVKSAKQAIINLPRPGKRAGSGLGDTEGIPGMRSLDEALATTGPLPAGGKVGMPGGALFEYDKADLLPEAIDDLRKLGELIQRNPRATFSIEGHTDSFGGLEYNLALSKRRADAVKSWLVQSFGITPERIQTLGFGNTRLIVPANRSIEEQGPNRRVEIVIKTRRR